MKLTQEQLKSFVEYNPETGEFIWIKDRSWAAKKGDVAGCKRKNNRIQLQILGKKYHAHRLAFLYMEGYFPEHYVDHIDRDPTNNRWDNLREVSPSCNARNMGNRENSKSGVKGVTWDNFSSKWVAQIYAHKKHKHLGHYTNVLDAAKARYEAEIKYDFLSCDKNSIAYQYIKEHDPEYFK